MECRYKKICEELFNPNGIEKKCTHEESLECPLAFKIEDLAMDKLPFEDEDYDGPEDEEL